MKLVRWLIVSSLSALLVFSAVPAGSRAGMAGIEFLGAEPFAGRPVGVVLRVLAPAQTHAHHHPVGSASTSLVDGMRTGALTVRASVVLDAAGVRIYGEPHGNVSPRTPESVKETVRHLLDNPRMHVRR